MDPTIAGAQTAGSRANSGEQGHGSILPQDVQLLWCELRGLAHDHLQLAALETQRAGESLITMIAAGMMVAGLLLSARLGLMATAVLALISHQVMDSGSSHAAGGRRQFADRVDALWRDPPPEP